MRKFEKISALEFEKDILDGKYDDLPEAAFLSVGTIEDVVKKAESLK